MGSRMNGGNRLRSEIGSRRKARRTWEASKALLRGESISGPMWVRPAEAFRKPSEPTASVERAGNVGEIAEGSRDGLWRRFHCSGNF